jgi:hypothetical protein
MQSGNTTDTPVMIIGNKFDLHSQRAVSEAQAFRKAEKLGCLYRETSAKTAYVENKN